MYKLYGWKLTGSLASEAALNVAGADYKIVPVNIKDQCSFLLYGVGEGLDHDSGNGYRQIILARLGTQKPHDSGPAKGYDHDAVVSHLFTTDPR